MKRPDLCDGDCREENGCHGPRPCARCGAETCALDLSDGTDEAVCGDCREEAEREAAEDEAAYDPPEGGEAGADALAEDGDALGEAACAEVRAAWKEKERSLGRRR